MLGAGFQLLLPFALSTMAFANNPYTSVQDPVKQGWVDADLVAEYFHNSHLQLDWAWDALNKYHHLSGQERILDFGSGDGKITALLSQSVPGGEVVGHDISAAMVDFASRIFPRRFYPNLSFRHVGNVDFITPSDEALYDLVTTFCVFHLVHNPEVVLRNVLGKLKSGGKIVGTLPAGGNALFFDAVNQALQKFALQGPSLSTGRPLTEFGLALADAGFKEIKTEVVLKQNYFLNKQRFIDWMVGTLSANWNIPEASRIAFFTEVAESYLAADPSRLQPDGIVTYELRRLDFVAKRP